MTHSCHHDTLGPLLRINSHNRWSTHEQLQSSGKLVRALCTTRLFQQTLNLGRCSNIIGINPRAFRLSGLMPFTQRKRETEPEPTTEKCGQDFNVGILCEKKSPKSTIVGSAGRGLLALGCSPVDPPNVGSLPSGVLNTM